MVCVEPNPSLHATLELNQRASGSHFHIVRGVVAHEPLLLTACDGVGQGTCGRTVRSKDEAAAGRRAGGAHLNEVLLNASFRVVPNVRLHALERRIFGTNKSEAHGEGLMHCTLTARGVRAALSRSIMRYSCGCDWLSSRQTVRACSSPSLQPANPPSCSAHRSSVLASLGFLTMFVTDAPPLHHSAFALRLCVSTGQDGAGRPHARPQPLQEGVQHLRENGCSGHERHKRLAHSWRQHTNGAQHPCSVPSSTSEDLFRPDPPHAPPGVSGSEA